METAMLEAEVMGIILIRKVTADVNMILAADDDLDMTLMTVAAVIIIITGRMDRLIEYEHDMIQRDPILVFRKVKIIEKRGKETGIIVARTNRMDLVGVGTIPTLMRMMYSLTTAKVRGEGDMTLIQMRTTNQINILGMLLFLIIRVGPEGIK